MKYKFDVETIKGTDVTLEGITIELGCSASEVVKVLAGVKTLIEGPESEVDIDMLKIHYLNGNIDVQKMLDKIMIQTTKEAKSTLDIVSKYL